MEIICRFGEITLKGLNRPIFERALARNVEQNLQRHAIIHKLRRQRGRLFVQVASEQCTDAIEVLRRTFGITSVSVAVMVELSYDAIESAILQMLKGKTFTTFRISAQRLQKKFDPTPTLHNKLGKFVEQHFGKKVDLENPGIDIGVEILDHAYVFLERLPGVGGLPVGMEGTVLALVEFPPDLLAAWLAMKRGCTVIPAQRTSFPVTFLQDYGCTSPSIRINHINDLSGLAKSHKAQALVVGQTLGTLQNFDVELPVLRPLVGYTAQALQEKMEELCIPLSRK